MIRPVIKCSGVPGVVETLIAISTVPVQTPFMEMTSPVCTSDKLMLPLLLILCILINMPFLNNEVVAWPMPELNVKLTSAGADVAAASAISDDFWSFFTLVAFFGATTLAPFFELTFAIKNNFND